MRDSWITRKLRNAGRKTVLIVNLLKISLLADTKKSNRLEKQEPKPNLILRKKDLLLILVVILILIFLVYITFKTGALESTRYYQLK